MTEKEIRLIDANEALLKIDKGFDETDPRGEEQIGFLKCRKIVREAPTIDPESLRPHGKWSISKTDWFELHIIQCSVCGEEWCFEELCDVAAMNYHYCPNCGAKMEE